ncbi:MAG: DUF1592 domain-containing protein [Verrucomicrobiota bacterium]
MRLLLPFLICVICVICGKKSAASSLDEQGFRAFLDKHCVQCHGPDKEKGDVRFDQLPLSSLNADHLETWKTALEQVTEFDMPPEDDLALSDEEIAHFKNYLEPAIASALDNVSREQVVLRRLNQEEYRNTVRDLFGINITVEDPARSVPPDEVAHGFDNLGSALTISDLHIDAYLAAAEDVVSRWEARAAAAAEADSFRLEVPVAPGEKPLIYWRGLNRTEEYIDLMHSAWTNRRFKTFVFPAKQTDNRLLPHGGTYRITVDAETLHTDDPRGAEIIAKLGLDWEPDPEETPRFGFFLRRPARSITPNIDQRVATFELEHGERKTMSVETWLPGGLYTLGINFDSGPRFDPSQTAALLYLMKQKRITNPKEISTGYDGEFSELRNVMKRPSETQQAIVDHIGSLPLPRIRFHSIVIEGPLEDQNAPTTDYLSRVNEDTNFQREELTRFARRTFRRPVTEEELQPYFEYAEKNGYRGALKAMLCSPHFLYHRENDGNLNDHAIANRLSYFLWNSMPDDELFELASVGKLRDESVLRAQLTRMLADEKAQSFYDRFTHQWLGLGNMDDMPASQNFVVYHDFFIKDLFREETTRFFEHLLKTNAPAADLVHADYTFMNSALARHYRHEGVTGSAFEKVALKDPQRRGLLGQGSVLTTSANGIDTSPVVRGIWVLEHLLGTPPAPPPPDVEVLEPDTTGTTTIREMYAAHRTQAECNRCHEDIDPLGFALENFNPVGQWRDQYEGGLPVDATGQMPDGREFQNVEGLRDLMRGSTIDLVAKHLLTNFLTTATGREMTVADDEEIQSILASTAKDGHRLNDLLFATLTSQAFTNK